MKSEMIKSLRMKYRIFLEAFGIFNARCLGNMFLRVRSSLIVADVIHQGARTSALLREKLVKRNGMELLTWRGRREAMEEHLLVLDWSLLCDRARDLGRKASAVISSTSCVCQTL